MLQLPVYTTKMDRSNSKGNNELNISKVLTCYNNQPNMPTFKLKYLGSNGRLGRA